MIKPTLKLGAHAFSPITSDDYGALSSGLSPYDNGGGTTNKDTALLTPNSQASAANLPPTYLPASLSRVSNKEHAVTPSKTPVGKKHIKIIKGKIASGYNARPGNAVHSSSTGGALPNSNLFASYNNEDLVILDLQGGTGSGAHQSRD